uniref:Nucleolar protein 4 n=1 Tax=Glossina morsitans morsitans TaxID=37546 RepID=A0A1B0FFA7_GLOMM
MSSSPHGEAGKTAQDYRELESKTSYSPTQHYQQHTLNLQEQQQQYRHVSQCATESINPLNLKRELYCIKEQEELVESKSGCKETTNQDIDYDADVDDDVVGDKMLVHSGQDTRENTAEKAQKSLSEKEHIFELFQPWAIKTYGDHSKTKTITMRKKVRILKALEGKEHSRPDSSKFRFWVKTKGFTTNRPDNFLDAPCTPKCLKPLPPDAVLSDNPADVNLYVASTSKDLDKRHYRKVAVVEEFFDIIFNIHMELGGRSGLHAGQKRTYRIISETYAFLPREAVTRFLSICPECKKNLRPSSPATCRAEVPQNESSSEVEALNYSSHTESSLEAGPTTKISTKSTSVTGLSISAAKRRRYSSPDNSLKPSIATLETKKHSEDLYRRKSSPPLCGPGTRLPKIRVNPYLQRPFTPPIPESSHLADSPYGLSFDFHTLKSRENLMRYYDFMRRLYEGNLQMSVPQIPNISFEKKPLQTANLTKQSQKKSVQKPLESSITSSSDDETDNVTVINPKRFKNSPESLLLKKALELPLKVPVISRNTVSTSFSTSSSSSSANTLSQACAINLSKQTLSVFSSALETPKAPKTASMPTTSTPTSVKTEAITPPKSTITTTLRIPQIRSTSMLPPLDFEHLKPITSTYLQLTRSMGLSDEEALRFDNLVSNETNLSLFFYCFIAKNLILFCN